MENQTEHPEITGTVEAPAEDGFSGLFNEAVKADIKENKDYYAALLTQWCTANEATGQISSQRNNINNFYMSLLSLLIGGLLLSDRVATESPFSRTVFLLTVLAVAVCCCMTWIRQIEKCKRINYRKFQIIARLEEQLPAKVISWEENVPVEEKKRFFNGGRNLSDYEKNLAEVFCGAILFIVVIMLLEIWWEPVCALIR